MTRIVGGQDGVQESDVVRIHRHGDSGGKERGQGFLQFERRRRTEFKNRNDLAPPREIVRGSITYYNCSYTFSLPLYGLARSRPPSPPPRRHLDCPHNFLRFHNASRITLAPIPSQQVFRALSHFVTPPCPFPRVQINASQLFSNPPHLPRAICISSGF